MLAGAGQTGSAQAGTPPCPVTAALCEAICACAANSPCRRYLGENARPGAAGGSRVCGSTFREGDASNDVTRIPCPAANAPGAAAATDVRSPIHFVPRPAPTVTNTLAAYAARTEGAPPTRPTARSTALTAFARTSSRSPPTRLKKDAGAKVAHDDFLKSLHLASCLAPSTTAAAGGSDKLLTGTPRFTAPDPQPTQSQLGPSSHFLPSPPSLPSRSSSLLLPQSGSWSMKSMNDLTLPKTSLFSSLLSLKDLDLKRDRKLLDPDDGIRNLQYLLCPAITSLGSDGSFGKNPRSSSSSSSPTPSLATMSLAKKSLDAPPSREPSSSSSPGEATEQPAQRASKASRTSNIQETSSSESDESAGARSKSVKSNRSSQTQSCGNDCGGAESKLPKSNKSRRSTCKELSVDDKNGEFAAKSRNSKSTRPSQKESSSSREGDEPTKEKTKNRKSRQSSQKSQSRPSRTTRSSRASASKQKRCKKECKKKVVISLADVTASLTPCAAQKLRQQNCMSTQTLHQKEKVSCASTQKVLVDAGNDVLNISTSATTAASYCREFCPNRSASQSKDTYFDDASASKGGSTRSICVDVNDSTVTNVENKRSRCAGIDTSTSVPSIAYDGIPRCARPGVDVCTSANDVRRARSTRSVCVGVDSSSVLADAYGLRNASVGVSSSSGLAGVCGIGGTAATCRSVRFCRISGAGSVQNEVLGGYGNVGGYGGGGSSVRVAPVSSVAGDCRSPNITGPRVSGDSTIATVGHPVCSSRSLPTRIDRSVGLNVPTRSVGTDYSASFLVARGDSVAHVGTTCATGGICDVNTDRNYDPRCAPVRRNQLDPVAPVAPVGTTCSNAGVRDNTDFHFGARTSAVGRNQLGTVGDIGRVPLANSFGLSDLEPPSYFHYKQSFLGPTVSDVPCDCKDTEYLNAADLVTSTLTAVTSDVGRVNQAADVSPSTYEHAAGPTISHSLADSSCVLRGASGVIDLRRASRPFPVNTVDAGNRQDPVYPASRPKGVDVSTSVGDVRRVCKNRNVSPIGPATFNGPDDYRLPANLGGGVNSVYPGSSVRQVAPTGPVFDGSSRYPDSVCRGRIISGAEPERTHGTGVVDPMDPAALTLDAPPRGPAQRDSAVVPAETIHRVCTKTKERGHRKCCYGGSGKCKTCKSREGSSYSHSDRQARATARPERRHEESLHRNGARGRSEGEQLLHEMRMRNRQREAAAAATVVSRCPAYQKHDSRPP